MIASSLGTCAAVKARADGSVSALHMGMGAKAGEMPRFDAVVAEYNASGERSCIDSHCQSACTIFLSIRHVCITPGATLLFHAGGTKRNGHQRSLNAAYAGRLYRLIKHEAVPNCGSFEVWFPDGKPSRYFYWESAR